jgi:hypothetical protein
VVQAVQLPRVSINVKRGLVATTHACMNHLKRRGLPARFADGLGDVLATGIQESAVIPGEEISILDLARAIGVLGKKRGRR